MPTNFELVLDFMEAMGQEVRTDRSLPDQETQRLRLDLISEEVNELAIAIHNKSRIGIADALADILYVTYGAGAAYGLDMDALFWEVHRSNMSKMGADGKPIRRSDGKVLKGPNYREPQLEPLLQLKLRR